MLKTQMDTKTARQIARLHNQGINVLPEFAICSVTVGDVLALNAEIPTLKKLGTCDDHNTCDLCGKTNIKHTVVFATEAEDIYVGSDCAESIEYVQRFAA